MVGLSGMGGGAMVGVNDGANGDGYGGLMVIVVGGSCVGGATIAVMVTVWWWWWWSLVRFVWK